MNARNPKRKVSFVVRILKGNEEVTNSITVDGHIGEVYEFLPRQIVELIRWLDEKTMAGKAIETLTL